MATKAFNLHQRQIIFNSDRLYETQIRPQVETDNHGQIVAIDIETVSFEVADDTMTATRKLYARLPDAQPWVVRIGYRAVHRY